MNKKFDINSITTKEIHDLIVNYKESQNVYFIRKEMGLSFKKFRKLVQEQIETLYN